MNDQRTPAWWRGKVAAEARGHGLTLTAVTCKGWKNTLKQDAFTRPGGPEVWRDWGNRFGEGPPRAVLAKVAKARKGGARRGHIWGRQRVLIHSPLQ